MSFIRKIRNPELFQGDFHRRGYFEGWYFKLIDRDMKTAAAAIPGVALGASRSSPDSHAFVQFIMGSRAYYFKYPLQEFKADEKIFHVSIGGSTFSRNGIVLNLEDENMQIYGELAFSDALPFPKTRLSPGIMGPFGYVPCMECYHGIVSIRHTICGTLNVEGQAVPFDGGSGYIEKDWGRAFPSCWVWVQANHFSRDAAFLFSVADIPWLRGSFTGFFSFLYLDGKLRRFATYTGAKLLRLTEYGGVTEAVIRDGNGTLEFAARPGLSGMLKAPKNGLMDRIIEESISSTVAVRWTDASGIMLFEGTSSCAGMERYEAERLYQRP